MKSVKKVILWISILFAGLLLLPGRVLADTLLPDELQDFLDSLGPGGSGVVQFVVGRIQLIFFLAIGFLILAAVVFALISSYKYIRSQGDPGQVEEAQKAIKAIFFGLAALMIAIIGMVIVFVFFGVNTPKPALFQVCVSAPNSVGCNVCKQDGNLTTCQFCEAVYRNVATRKAPDINNDGNIDSVDIRAIVEVEGLVGDGRNCVEPLQGGNQPLNN